MKITFDGGLNENDGTAPNECQEGYNFDLVWGDTNLTPRKPIDLKGTSPIAGTVAGIMQLIKRDDSETTIIFDDNTSTPTVYLWDGSTTFTSKRTTGLVTGSKLRSLYYSLDDRLAVVDINKKTPLMTWDGTTFERHKTGLTDSTGASITGITQTSGTATITYGAAHGKAAGDLITVTGASPTGYNGEVEILTIPTGTTATYAVNSGLSTPATGTITAEGEVTLYAKYGVVHNGRQWLLNVTTDSDDTAHLIVASAFEDIEAYDTAARAENGTISANAAFYMLTPDLKPVNGVAQFNKELIISTFDGKLYRLVGNDATNYKWIDYYSGSAAIGTETMVNFGNDVALMRRGGRIDTLRQTDASGDVTVDDISRWIPLITSSLSESISVYDNDRQKVYFFVQSKILVLYKEYLYGSKVSPWSIFTTDVGFNFNTSSAVRIRRPGGTSYSVYIGGNSGEIYDLNGTGNGDGGTTNVVMKRRSSLIDSIETKKAMLTGSVHYRRIEQVDLVMNFDWSEEYNITKAIVSLKGRAPTDSASPYFGGGFYFNGNSYYNGGFEFEGRPTNQRFSPSGRGPKFFFEVTTDSQYEYQIDYITLEV